MGNAAKRGACLDGGAGRGPSEEVVNCDIPGYSAADAAAIVAAAAAADAAPQTSKLQSTATGTRRQIAQPQQQLQSQFVPLQGVPYHRQSFPSSLATTSQQAWPAQPGQSLPQALEASLRAALSSSSSSAVSRAVNMVNESISTLTHEAASEVKSHLQTFAEDELCRALQSGDCMHMVHCARLLVFLGGDEPGTGAGNVIAGPPTTMLQNRRARRGLRVRAARAQATAVVRRHPPSRCVVEYWEEEVHAAWRRRDAADLAWALQLAEEAGVPESSLQAPRAALRQLAQVALAEAARHGDTYTLVKALRVAEELGVADELLTEARLSAAESCRDPHLIAQELLHAREAGLPAARCDAATKMLQALQMAEIDAATRGLTSSLSCVSIASHASATSSDEGAVVAPLLPNVTAEASEIAATEVEYVDCDIRQHPKVLGATGVDPFMLSIRPESISSASTRPESSAGTARTAPESVSSSSTRPESAVGVQRAMPDSLSGHSSAAGSCSFRSDGASHAGASSGYS